MNERKEAMKASLVQAESGASQTGLRSPFFPAPWHIGEHTVGMPIQALHDANDDFVADAFGESAAARIVQCVNSHDDLVAALERICHYANDVSEGGHSPSLV